jgi:hypothetical protein
MFMPRPEPNTPVSTLSTRNAARTSSPEVAIQLLRQWSNAILVTGS